MMHVQAQEIQQAIENDQILQLLIQQLWKVGLNITKDHQSNYNHSGKEGMT